MVDVGYVTGSVLLQMMEAYPNPSLTRYDHPLDLSAVSVTRKSTFLSVIRWGMFTTTNVVLHLHCAKFVFTG
jgi:hypothetical protein